MTLRQLRERVTAFVRNRKKVRRAKRHAAENDLGFARRRLGKLAAEETERIKGLRRRIRRKKARRAHRVIPRSEWGARAPRSTSPLSSTSNGVFIHHTVGPSPDTLSESKAEMRNIQRFHMDSRGWNDIAYSFVVDENGNVFEGRGKGVAGAHTQGYNSTSYAICFMGNYETQQPTNAAIAAARWVRREYLRLGDKPLRAHSQVNSTACPGRNLRARLGDI